MTVTLHDAERFDPSTVVAVIVASPTAIAVTTPLASTVAIDSSDDDHSTDFSVANSGSTIATSVSVSFASRLISDLSSVIDVANVGMTVTLHVAERFEPSTVVAVIVASPTAIAVTTPLASTVAIDSSEDDQVTALFIANSGRIVATSIALSATSRLISDWSSVIEEAY